MNPNFRVEDIDKEKKVILEEIKMVEDTPDDLVHELFNAAFSGKDTRSGADSSGPRKSVESFTSRDSARLFPADRTWRRTCTVGGGNVEHRHRWRESHRHALREAADGPRAFEDAGRRCSRRTSSRSKELEQSHLCSAPTAIRRITPIATSATS
jgi:hypothetical protein